MEVILILTFCYLIDVTLKTASTLFVIIVGPGRLRSTSVVTPINS